LSEAGLSLLPHLRILLESYTSAKVNFELFEEYILFKDESEEIEMKSFQSKMTIMNKNSDLLWAPPTWAACGRYILFCAAQEAQESACKILALLL